MAQIQNNHSENLLYTMVQKQCKALQTHDVTVDARLGQMIQMQVNLSGELIEALEQRQTLDFQNLAEVLTTLQQNHSQALKSRILSLQNHSIIDTKLDAL